MSNRLELMKFLDVSIKISDRKMLQSNSKPHNGSLTLYAISQQDFAVVVTEDVSRNTNLILLTGKNKWKVNKVNHGILFKEDIKQGKNIIIKSTKRQCAFDNWMESITKLVDGISWTTLLNLKQFYDKICELPKTFDIKEFKNEKLQPVHCDENENTDISPSSDLNNATSCNVQNKLNGSSNFTDDENEINEDEFKMPKIEIPSSNKTSLQTTSVTPNKSNNFYKKTTDSPVDSPKQFLNTISGRRSYRKDTPILSPFNGNNRVAKTLTTNSTQMITSSSVSPSTSRSLLNINKKDISTSPLILHNKVKPEISGLRNIGNSCYMNVIIQSLFNIECFKNDFLVNFEKLLNDKDVDNGCFLLTVCHLFSVMQMKQVTRRHMELIKTSFVTKAKNFAGNEQHDAQEFFMFFLDILRDEILELNKKKNNSTIEYFINSPNLNFEMTTLEKLYCRGCGKVIIKKENNLNMSLLMPEKPSLKAALDGYLSDEEVDYKCEFCDSLKALITHKFDRLPRVLVLHLKRYNNLEKQRTAITIPRYLSVAEYCNDDTAPPSFSSSCTPSDNYLEAIVTKYEKRLDEIDNSKSTVNSTDENIKIEETNILDSDENDDFKINRPKGNRPSYGKKKFNFNKKTSTSQNTSPYFEEPSAKKMKANDEVEINIEENKENGLAGGSPAVKEAVEKNDTVNDLLSNPVEISTEDDDYNKAIKKSLIDFEEMKEAEDKLLKEALEQSLKESTPSVDHNDVSLDESKDDEDLYDNIDESKPAFSYRLASIISHSGGITGGHYTCSVLRLSDGKWFKCNDNEVTSLFNQDEKSLLNECKTYGYIFFYVNKFVLNEINYKSPVKHHQTKN